METCRACSDALDDATVENVARLANKVRVRVSVSVKIRVRVRFRTSPVSPTRCWRIARVPWR